MFLQFKINYSSNITVKLISVNGRYFDAVSNKGGNSNNYRPSQRTCGQRGHPLGLIYARKSVQGFFCNLNYTKSSSFGICINPKGCPPLTFINPKFFRGCPSLTFHQAKGFQGVPTFHFSSTQRFLGGAHLSFFINQRFFWGAHPSLFINPKVLCRSNGKKNP